MPDKALLGKGRGDSEVIPYPAERDLTGTDVLRFLYSPTAEETIQLRRAEAFKKDHPARWAAMAWAVFREKRPERLAPIALVMQASTIGVTRARKIWLTSDGSYWF